MPVNWSKYDDARQVSATVDSNVDWGRYGNVSPNGRQATKTDKIEFQENSLPTTPNKTQRLAEAIAKKESGGDYSAMGKPVNGDRAHGKYQIMGKNIPSWSKEFLGKEITTEEFMANPKYQDAIAQGKIRQLLNKGYSIEDAGSIWISGRPKKGNDSRDKVTGISAKDYAKDILDNYNGTQGWKGVAEDAYEGVKRIPGDIMQTAKELPTQAYQGAKQLFTNPTRAIDNLAYGAADLGRDIGNLPATAAEYLSSKGIIDKQPWVNKWKAPGEQSVNPELFGLQGKQEGDDFIQGLWAFPTFGSAGELGALSKMGRVGARAGAQGAYGATEGQNPLEAALMSASLEGAIKAPAYAGRALTSVPKTISKNEILSKLRRDQAKGSAFTPQQTSQNLTGNHLSPEGQPLEVDIGSLTGSPALKNIYKASSSVPFSGGSKQKNMTSRLAEERKEAQARSEYENTISEADALAKSAAVPFEGKAPANTVPEISKKISEVEKAKALADDSIDKAPQFLEALRSNHENPSKKVAADLREVGMKRKEKAEGLYKPVRESAVNLFDLAKKEDFKRYNEAFNEMKDLSDELVDVFGKDKALGSKVSDEVKRAQNFVESPSDTLSINTALKHIRTMQSLAQKSIESGKRAEGRALNKMANGLKGDIKDILYANGHEDVASSLEKADAYYKENIIPLRKSKEIRETIDNKKYIPDVKALTKKLHNQNYEGILNELPEDTKNHLIYESVTGGNSEIGKPSAMSGKEISSSYEGLSGDQKFQIKKTNPEVSAFIDALNRAQQDSKSQGEKLSALKKQEKSAIKELDSHQKEYDKRRVSYEKEAIKKIQESKTLSEDAKKRLNSAVRQKFKESSPYKSAAMNSVKDIGALATFLGASAGGILAPKALAATAGITIPLAKKLNKFLTSAELKEKYIKGGKYGYKEGAKNNIKKPDRLPDFFSQALSKPITAYSQQRGNQT